MESLGLDIKLLVAQIVNFAILFFVLKKVLYKPLIKVIDERNKKIDDSLINSQKIEETLAKIEQKEADVMDKARQKAKKEREELVALAEAEKAEIIEAAKASANREVEKGLDAIKAAETDAVNALTDKFMGDLVSKLEEKIAARSKSKKYPVLREIIQ
jgi:F-type H+-transporting ATPase subunit b